jgi:hypothetical protein
MRRLAIEGTCRLSFAQEANKSSGSIGWLLASAIRRTQRTEQLVSPSRVHAGDAGMSGILMRSNAWYHV